MLQLKIYSENNSCFQTYWFSICLLRNETSEMFWFCSSPVLVFIHSKIWFRWGFFYWENTWRCHRCSINSCITAHNNVFFFFMCREVRTCDVCRLRQSNPWPVHPAGLPRPGVARSLFEMRGVQPIPGRDMHLLRTGRENILQERLCKVGFLFGLFLKNN